VLFIDGTGRELIDAENDMDDSIFPLPLTPFEKFMLADDRADYPMTFTLCYEFSGQIDRPAFEKAYHQALERHPLLTAIVRKRRHWIATDRRREIEWVEDGTNLLGESGEYLDVEAEHGLRAWVESDEDRYRLITQFHHSCCDGLGALQFQGDWFACYDALVQQKKPNLLTLHPELLKRRVRSRWKIPAGVTVSWWHSVKAQLHEFYKYSNKKVQPLRGEQKSRPTEYPGIHHTTLSLEQTHLLIKSIEQRGVQLNDLVMRDLMLTLREWNGLDAHAQELISINMPTSLRDRSDSRMPATNVVGYTFLDATAAECLQPDALLDQVTLETAEIRRWNMGQYSLDGMAAISRLPFGLKWLSSPQACHATTVLSNLGDPTRRFYRNLPQVAGKMVTGAMTLEHFYGTPPLRPLTRATILLSMYSGRLTISLRGDRHWLSSDQARMLLGRLVEKILLSVEHLSPSAN